MFLAHGTNFDESGRVCIAVTKLLDHKFAERFLASEESPNLLDKFVAERLNGEKFIRDTIDTVSSSL